MPRRPDRRRWEASYRRGRMAILAINAALLAATWLAVTGLLRIDRDNTVRSAIQRNANLAIGLEQYTIRTLEGADTVLRQLARQYVRAGETIDLTAFIKGYPLDNTVLVGVGLIDASGQAAFSAAAGDPVGTASVAEREVFKVHAERDTGRLFVGRPFIGPFIGKPVIPLTRRINKPDGSFAGVAMAVLETRRFTDLLQAANLRPLDVLSLIGMDGITRARLIGTQHSWGEDISRSSLFSEAAARPVGDFSAEGQRDGVFRYYSYRVLRDYGVVATVGAAESDVLADYHRRRVQYVGAASLASMAIVAFAALLLRMLAAQHQAERAMRQHTHRLQELSRQLLSIKEQERRFLGRELHDRIGGNLNALLMNLEALRQSLPGDPAPALTRRLGDSENLVRETLSNVRHILSELRPTALDELGLRAALEHHASAMAGRANLAIEVKGEEIHPRLPPAAEISLFRIAQEAVNNAVRHAHASHVTLELRMKEGEVILEIADDGAGFREGAVATIPGSGLGMLTMRERAEALGGRLEVQSSAQGTVIRVRLPAADDLYRD